MPRLLRKLELEQRSPLASCGGFNRKSISIHQSRPFSSFPCIFGFPCLFLLQGFPFSFEHFPCFLRGSAGRNDPSSLFREGFRKNAHELFWHKLFEHPQRFGTSQQNSRDIPDSSLRNSSPKEDKLSREGMNFSATTPLRGRPPPYRAVSGPKKLIFVLFCFPELGMSKKNEGKEDQGSVQTARNHQGATTAQVSEARPWWESTMLLFPLWLRRTCHRAWRPFQGCTIVAEKVTYLIQ